MKRGNFFTRLARNMTFGFISEFAGWIKSNYKDILILIGCLILFAIMGLGIFVMVEVGFLYGVLYFFVLGWITWGIIVTLTEEE